MDLSKIQLTREDVDEFQFMTRSWQDFCNEITNLDRAGLRRLMVYLKVHRPSSYTMLTRAVSRYNAISKVELRRILWPNPKREQKHT